MKYSEKIKFCRECNSDPIYELYSDGVRCCVYKDVKGIERLQVMHLGYHLHLDSKPCNDWEEDYILEWIINATKQLKEMMNGDGR